MIRTYYLPIERINNTEQVIGSEFIHNALVECTKAHDTRKVIMDTTTEEDAELAKLAISVKNSSQEEMAQLEDAWAMSPTEPARNIYAEIDNIKSRLQSIENTRPVRL